MYHDVLLQFCRRNSSIPSYLNRLLKIGKHRRAENAVESKKRVQIFGLMNEIKKKIVKKCNGNMTVVAV